MITSVNGVERKLSAEAGVDCFDAGAGLFATGDVGLVGDDQEQIAGVAKAGERFGDTGFYAHRFDTRRRMRCARENEGFDEDAVAVEEDRGARGGNRE
jgi:hypothetical protein